MNMNRRQMLKLVPEQQPNEYACALKITRKS